MVVAYHLLQVTWRHSERDLSKPNHRLLHLSVSTFVPRVFLSLWWMLLLMSPNPLDCPSVFAPVANQPPYPCICLPAFPQSTFPAPTLSLATIISHLGLLHEFLSGSPLLVKPKSLNMVPKCPSGLVLQLFFFIHSSHPLTSSNSGYDSFSCITVSLVLLPTLPSAWSSLLLNPFFSLLNYVSQTSLKPTASRQPLQCPSMGTDTSVYMFPQHLD